MLTGEDSGVVIWDEDDVSSPATRRPKQVCHLNTDGTVLDYDSGWAVVDDIVLAQERIKIVVAEAGTGKRRAYLDIWTGP